MWSMTGTHILLQSSGLNSGTPLDPVLSLAVLTTPKQMGKQKDSTGRLSRLLDVSWQSNHYLNHYGVACCITLILLSVQTLHGTALQRYSVASALTRSWEHYI